MMSRLHMPRPRQGVAPSRKSDTGPIPDAMLKDLRQLLWSMEGPPRYWAIAMGIAIGALWIAGVAFFAIADTRISGRDPTLPIATIALSVLAAMGYAPFANRCSNEGWEAGRLREALYSQRLEDLADHMAGLRIGGRDDLADRLGAIWQRHGLEPGWMARPAEPKPRFR